MQRRADVYIELSLSALRKLPKFLLNQTRDTYLHDDYCQSAIERQLEIAGDALAQLRKHAPEVFQRIPDGALIIGFRNVLAHGYATIDPAKVFDAATVEAPVLATCLERLLKEFPDPDSPAS